MIEKITNDFRNKSNQTKRDKAVVILLLIEIIIITLIAIFLPIQIAIICFLVAIIIDLILTYIESFKICNPNKKTSKALTNIRTVHQRKIFEPVDTSAPLHFLLNLVRGNQPRSGDSWEASSPSVTRSSPCLYSPRASSRW